MRKQILATSVVVALALLVGCSSDDDNNPIGPGPQPNPGTADVTVAFTDLGWEAAVIGDTTIIAVTTTMGNQLAATSLPSGASFDEIDSVTWHLTWSPTAGQAGRYTVSVTESSRPGAALAVQETNDFILEAIESTRGLATWDETNRAWEITVDARNSAEYAHLDLATGMITETDWDMRFRRFEIGLNGGVSGSGGVTGYNNRDVKTFAEVSMADAEIIGAGWVEDSYDLQINEWFIYNFVTHQLTMTSYVYSMWEAADDPANAHAVKFRVDSIVGGGMPPNMGTMWISYVRQDVAGSPSLTGAVQTLAIPVGVGPAYFDFATGSIVTPSDPMTSYDWDIRIENYEIRMNSGPFGPGSCTAFPWHRELTDPTDIESVTSIVPPGGAPTFGEGIASAIVSSPTATDSWYEYSNQQLTPRGFVYLLNMGSAYYKVELTGYYGILSGQPTSAMITLMYREL